MEKHRVAGRIEVNGIVQGVGFRPFIYNLALRHGLKGEVYNTTSGVAIVVEGTAGQLDAFAADISAAPPPLAHIVEVSRQSVPVTGYTAFTIVQSKADTDMSTIISPDGSICEDCRRELFDPNRDIYLRSDDSVVPRAAGDTRQISRSRGYVPVPVFLKEKLPNVLAVGAELKNTVCLTKDHMAFLSQHIGDLENLATYEFFELTIRHMQRILAVEPDLIAHDMHPDYMSTNWARAQEGPKIAVQHHHAHIVSAMAENKLDGPVIGLSFDGTGYGSDGAIWGGEVLLADEQKFDRAAHFAYLPMPGSTAAIKQPWRMGLSYLYAAYGDALEDLPLPFLRGIEGTRATIILEMIKKRINAPLTSSLGRLFDGVAALVGFRNEVAFEGQAAMELEMMAAESADHPYDFNWPSGAPVQIPTEPIIRAVVEDLLQGTAPAVISARFHLTLVRLFTDFCDQLRRDTGLTRVVLSGGVFQNAILLGGLVRTLEGKNLKVYTHKQVPTNDGGLSLGQAIIAAAMATRSQTA